MLARLLFSSSKYRSYCRAGSKFTVFAMFYFVFVEGNFPSTGPRGAYIWKGDLTEGFLRYRFGGAYIWRGLYMEELIFGILRYFILIEDFLL